MPNVVDDLTGEVIGSVKSYGKPKTLSRGPCVFGVVPFVPGEDFPSRALAAMRESPMRDPKRPGQPLWHRVDGHLVFEPALDAAQAYEPHGVTLGLAQAISKHGAAQRLLGALFEAAPEVGAWVRERGYESCGAGICEAPGAWSDEDDEDREMTGWFTDDPGDEGEPVSLDTLRSEHFVVTVHRALGGRLPGVSSDEQARLAAISQAVQVRFFWGMVLERWAVAAGKLAERHADTATLVTRLQEQRRELADRVRVLEWQIQRAAERVGPLGQAPIQVRRASPKTMTPRKKP